MYSGQMSHSRIATRLNDLDHGLVVFMKDRIAESRLDNIPEVQERNENLKVAVMTRNKFGLSCAARLTALLLGEALLWESSVGTFHLKLDSGRRFLCRRAAAQVGVGVKMRLDVFRVVSAPTVHPVMLASINVAHQLVEASIAVRSPSRNE